MACELAIVGGGNMGTALLRGARRANALTGEVCIAEPDPAKHAPLRELGAVVVADAAGAMAHLRAHEASPGAGQVLLAVKPQVFPLVAPALRAGCEGGRVVMSIMAGVTLARLASLIGSDARAIRLMPNTPAAIGQGLTAICPGPSLRPGDDALARRLAGSVGQVEDLPEALMDAFTALAGSGPAYAYYLAEAMTDAAVALGFDAAQGARIARATLAGAGAMLAQSPEPARDLRRAVTSPGGTTEAACRVLDEAGVRASIVAAIRAGRDRGATLSSG